MRCARLHAGKDMDMSELSAVKDACLKAESILIVALVREYFAALDSWAEYPTDDAHTRLHAADIALRREAGCDAVHVMKVAEMGGGA